MAIGWDDLGDFRRYSDHNAVAKRLSEAYHLKGYPINDSRACYDFLHSMSAGDRVFVKRGRHEVVGYGIVTGDYEYRPERPTYRNVREVRWERRGNWKCKFALTVKTLTNFTSYKGHRPVLD
jgi:predicted Mrr-cat superfamily restriction endonuclease